MRSYLMLLSILVTVLSASAQSVLLPNGDFENWNSITADDISDWTSANPYTIPSLGAASVKKIQGISGSGSFAVRLETVGTTGKTHPGFISNSKILGQGIPFTFQATKFIGTYRYNLVNFDTALLIVYFKKNGSTISANEYRITGAQGTAAPFSFNLQPMGVTPDSVFIALMSGNRFTGNHQAGSWLEIDDIAFEDGSLYVPAPNGDFENWQSSTFDHANDWYYDGFEMSKTTDKHTGNSAIKLISADNSPTHLYLVPVAPHPVGMPYTKKNDTLTGYYKYTSVGGDVASVTITVLDKNNIPIIVQPAGQFSTKQLAATNTYTYFEIPLPADDTPTHMMIEFQSSQLIAANAGSTLYIDNLRLKNFTVSVDNVTSQASSIVVYPNPATNVLHIKHANSTKESIDVNLYNISGALMYSHSFKHNANIDIPIKDLAVGLYQYKITRGEQTVTGKFIKE